MGATCCGPRESKTDEITGFEKKSQLKDEPPKKGMGKKIDFKKNKRNPADFMFSKLVNKVAWKDKGSLNGADFSIRYCEKSIIYVIDPIAEVKID